MKKVMFFLILLLLMASCGRERFKTATYDGLAQSHQVIAVVPVQTVMTGRLPRDVSPEMIKEIEERESQAFQISLFNEIARRTGARGGEIRIGLQHYTETNALLEAAGLSMRDSWKRPPAELAKLLGVDAIVRSTIYKTQYLTNLESFGLDVATTLLLFGTGLPIWLLPNGRTSTVDASCSIIDGETGMPVWSTNRRWSTDWSRPHAEIVDNIARRLARRFPYREY